MGQIGNGVSLKGIHQEEFNYPFLVSGTPTTQMLLDGGAVTLDTAANNTVKIAGVGDRIMGKLESYENRVVEGIKIGAVATKGSYGFKYNLNGAGTDVPPAIGGSVVGSAGGKVEAAAASADNVVVEVDTTNSICVVILK